MNGKNYGSLVSGGLSADPNQFGINGKGLAGTSGEGVGGFSPLDVSGLNLWVDFSDATTLFKDATKLEPVEIDGDLIGAAEDKSGNENDVTQATTGNKPAYKVNIRNGLSVARSSDDDTFLSSVAFQPFASKRGCIFFVMQNTSGVFANFAGTFDGNDPDFLFYSTLSGGTKYKWYDGAVQRDSTQFDVINTWGIQGFYRVSNTSSWLRRDGHIDDVYVLTDNQPASNPFILFNYNGAATGLIGDIAEVLVYDEITLSDIKRVEEYLSVKWNIPLGGIALAFGDSTTIENASTEADRWINIIADSLSWDVVNSGITTTTLQNTTQNTVSTIGASTDDNGADTYSTRVNVYFPDKVFILYGLNDLRLNDVAFTSSLFESDLESVVDGIVASGIDADNIIIGSPPYVSDYSTDAPLWNAGTVEKHEDYRDKCALVASSKGTGYVDVYQWMLDNGGDSLVSVDGIHPNDAGHTAIANAFLSVL